MRRRRDRDQQPPLDGDAALEAHQLADALDHRPADAVHRGLRRDPAEQFQEEIAKNGKVMVCCGRMGPMCIPVYGVMEQIESKYPVEKTSLRIGARLVQLLQIRDLEEHIAALIEERQAQAGDLPYWAKVWEPSLLLAYFAGRQPVVFGRRFLEIGAGLGIVGIYGVISYAVGRRTREMGLRMAMGAEPGRVTRMVLRQGLIVALVGVEPALALILRAGRLVDRREHRGVLVELGHRVDLGLVLAPAR